MREEEANRLVAGLFESHYAVLVRYAWRTAGSLERAEEIAQDVFFDLYKQLRNGHAIDNPVAWTFTAARNALRREARRNQLLPVFPQDPDVLELLAEAPPLQEESEPDFDRVTRLFFLLSPREEEVLLLRLAPLRYEEIGTQLGITAKAVSTLLTRAIQKLRNAAGVKSPDKTETETNGKKRRGTFR